MTLWPIVYYLIGLGLIVWLYVHRDRQRIQEDALLDSLTVAPVTKSHKRLMRLADGFMLALLACGWPLLLIARLWHLFQPQSHPKT